MAPNMRPVKIFPSCLSTSTNSVTDSLNTPPPPTSQLTLLLSLPPIPEIEALSPILPSVLFRCLEE
jgi:hypothetical protein